MQNPFLPPREDLFVPRPSEKQMAEAKRLSRGAFFLSVVSVIAGAAMFAFDLSAWVGYSAGIGGIVSWCMFVSSKQATQPPGHGLFGRRHK